MSDLLTRYDFQHYYFLAVETDCPHMDDLANHDFGHGKLVRFEHALGRAIALSIQGKSVVILENNEDYTYRLVRPSARGSSFRIFNSTGDSFYDGDVIENHDVSNIMKQICYYI